MVLSLNRSRGSEKLSKNFRVGEFACQCGRCAEVLVDEALVERLQQIRDRFGKGVVITSGYRCPAHNKAVGGVTESRHTKGQAADFRISGVAPAEIAKFAESIGVLGIGLYEDFVHIDTRDRQSFWYGHQQAYRSTFGSAPKRTFKVELSELQCGCGGEEVRALQAHLRGCGYKIDADGVFGRATETAVKQYQTSHGLTADGVVGLNTRQSLLGIRNGR